MTIDPNPLQKRLFFSYQILGLALIVFFGPMMARQIYTSPDFIDHIQTARIMLEQGTVLKSHFLFHVLSILFYGIIKGLGGSFPGAAFLTQMVALLALGSILFFIVHSNFPTDVSWKGFFLKIVFTLSLMIITPFHLFSLPSHELYLGYVGITVYHSPTMTLLKPLALLSVLYVLKIFHPPARGNSLWAVLILAVLVAVSALAKPSFLICLLPALFLIAVIFLFKKRRLDWRMIFAGVVIPSLLLLWWQYSFTYSHPEDGTRGIIFAPLEVIRLHSQWLLPKLMLSILFPLYIAIAYFKDVLRDLSLRFAWLMFFIGIFYQYFLAETGYRFGHGNFFWSAQITLFILFVFSFVFLLHQSEKASGDILAGPWSRKFIIGLILFAAHVGCGLIWYATQITDRPYGWW